MKTNKIQALLISHLTKHGQIELVLPDGMTVEIGVNQENKHGDMVVQDNYCWVIAKQRNRATVLDSYNLGLSFDDKPATLVFEDRYVDQNGKSIRQLDVV